LKPIGNEGITFGIISYFVGRIAKYFRKVCLRDFEIVQAREHKEG